MKPINEAMPRKNGLRFAAFYSQYGMFAILLIIVVVSSCLSNKFFSTPNLLNILRTTSPTGLVALGMTLILILGQIDLSVGSVMALSGCVACLINKNIGNTWMGILAAMGIGMMFGLINGGIITSTKIPSFITTLGTQYIARGAAMLITGGFPISKMYPNFKILGQGYIFGIIPTPIVVMLICFIVVGIVLHKTRFGRYIFATGGNEQAAKASGINTNWTILKSFLIHGALCGLAGVMLMSRLNSGQPAGATNYEFYAITAAVVGGTSLMGGIGNCVGTLTGAVIVGVLDNILLLRGVDTYWQYVIKGCVIVLAVIADFKTKAALRKA